MITRIGREFLFHAKRAWRKIKTWLVVLVKSDAILWLLPYIYAELVKLVFQSRGGVWAYGGEILIPVFILLALWMARRLMALKKEEDEFDFPVAMRRFTSEVDGEVSIKTEDIQEVILYLNEVENYIEDRRLNHSQTED